VTPIAETIRSFEELCDGKHDSLREDAFMYVGGIDERPSRANDLSGREVELQIANCRLQLIPYSNLHSAFDIECGLQIVSLMEGLMNARL